MADVTYKIPLEMQGLRVFARPCEWNKSGVFLLDSNLTQKDLRYLKEVIGYPIEVVKKPIVQKKKKVDAAKDKDISD
jgi:hypothetical protein